jgi:hypothetical protein
MLGPPSGGKDSHMHAGKFVFSQLLEELPRWHLRECVSRYRGNRRVRQFTCWDQFIVMVFAQLTYRESLRDIETCLRALPDKLYHVGLRSAVARATLADANENRSWQIWADLAQVLMADARALYGQDPIGVRLKDSVYAFDTTTIDLCLTLFPWCQFRRRKSAVKLHTLLDLRGHIPCFIAITSGATHEVTRLDDLPLEAGSYYLMDRGFVDFARLHRFTRERAYFVTRAKENMTYRVSESRAVDKRTGLRADQSIRLTGPLTRTKYPELLRRVSFVDPQTGLAYVFLANNFTLAPSTICRLYKCRWQVELFFKWIKQYLRIKTFLGTSENAVKTQVWIALCTYLLVAILRKRRNITLSMGDMLQILSVTLFEKTPVLQVFSTKHADIINAQNHKPLPLLEL